jgi:thiosulfate/3-mercaptopyruvate sulfurtransferase
MKLSALFFLIALFLIPLRASSQACEITAETPMLVGVDWLSEHLDHKQLVLLHVGPKPEYDEAHIPGAQFVQLNDLSSTREESDLSLQLPPPERLKAALEKLGISNDSRVVIYFGTDWVSPATRVYFTLDYAGLGNNTSILDGGMPAWKAADKPVTKEVVPAKRASLTVKPNDSVVAKYDWVNANLGNNKVRVIDARNPPFYTGENAGGQPRAGRIKGAKNIPFDTIVDKTNVFLPKDELLKKFTDAGVQPYDTVVTYCHIGQQGTVDYFAAKLLGLKVKLYDGSFQEWSRIAELPVENEKGNKGNVAVSVVTPAWLEQHAADANLRIIDVRLNVYDYFAGHALNASHLADAALRGPSEGYPTQYFEPFQTAQLFARAGVKKGDKVALYSDGDGVLGATMTAYLLERVGVNEIYVVDGGWRDYKAAQKTTQEYPVYKAAQPDVLDNRGVRATIDDVKNAIGKNVKFIDARPPEVYRGETKIWVRNGHIPGAYSIPWKLLVEENNLHKFKPLDEMRKVFADKGFKETDDIIVYCGTSREASLEYVVLKHLLKFQKVRLYEGSWAEYSNRPELAVETGAGR